FRDGTDSRGDCCSRGFWNSAWAVVCRINGGVAVAGGGGWESGRVRDGCSRGVGGIYKRVGRRGGSCGGGGSNTSRSCADSNERWSGDWSCSCRWGRDCVQRGCIWN